MLTRYHAVKDEQTRKRYRQMGYNAYKNGIDRSVSDDFDVEYRSYVRQGWDQAHTTSFFESLNIGGASKQSKLSRKFSQ